MAVERVHRSLKEKGKIMGKSCQTGRVWVYKTPGLDINQCGVFFNTFHAFIWE